MNGEKLDRGLGEIPRFSCNWFFGLVVAPEGHACNWDRGTGACGNLAIANKHRWLDCAVLLDTYQLFSSPQDHLTLVDSTRVRRVETALHIRNPRKLG